jgi:hypothetical protein
MTKQVPRPALQNDVIDELFLGKQLFPASCLPNPLPVRLIGHYQGFLRDRINICWHFPGRNYYRPMPT